MTRYYIEPTPSYGGKLDFHVQQEKPDASLWSVTFFIDGVKQAGSTQYFATRQEALDFGNEAIGFRG